MRTVLIPGVHGRETVRHRFETAGLGKAPFSCVGVRRNAHANGDGTEKPGGTCDFCGTGIMYEFVIESADGQRHKVGCDCIAKVGDEGLRKYAERHPEWLAMKRAKEAAKAAKVLAELDALIPWLESDFRALPHPMGFKDRQTGVALTRWDWLTFMRNCCGRSGRVTLLRTLKKL